MKDLCWKTIGITGDRSCPKLGVHGHCRDCATFSQQGRALLDREAPENYLDDWMSLLAQERASVSRDLKTVQVFRLMSEWLALPASCWVEVVGICPVRSIPHRSNQVLMGIVSVRGEIQLCMSLANLLGIEKVEGEESEIVRKASPRFGVIRRDGVSWVFPVDEIHGLVSYAEKDVEAVPSTLAKSFQKYTRGLLNVEGMKCGLLEDRPVFDAFSRSVV
jgi:chemotaxis-related protein WspD